MKKFFWCFFVFGFVINLSFANTFIAKALSQIVTNFYVDRNENFDLIICGTDTRKFSEIANEMAKKIEFFSTVTISKENQIVVNRTSILFFNTLEIYQDFHNKSVLGNMFPKEFNIFVYIDNFNVKHASKLITRNPLAPESIFRHQSFLVHNKVQDLSLITFTLFQQPNCRNWKIEEINKFLKSTGKWKTKMFSFEKFQTFNGCQLVITAPYPHHPVIQVDFDGETYTRIWGYATTFNTQISQNLNYTFIYNPHNLYTNERFNKSMKVDFYISSTSMRRIFTEDPNGRVITDRFTTIDNIILVSRFEMYSQFDKIFLPFESEVWYSLIATMLAAVFVVIVMTFAPKRIRDFVLGMNVQTPLLNLV